MHVNILLSDYINYCMSVFNWLCIVIYISDQTGASPSLHVVVDKIFYGAF